MIGGHAAGVRRAGPEPHPARRDDAAELFAVVGVGFSTFYLLPSTFPSTLLLLTCRKCPPAASSTSTWTPSTRRSSSATIRRCAASRWRSAAARRGAASSRRRATRRARSACARRCRWRARSGSARTLVIVRPDFHEVPRRVAGGVRDLPRGHAAGRAAVARRGVPRRHRERLGRAARREVARRLKAAIREATGLTASAGVAPNKFLAKIASGWRKPDGLTVIAPERVERVPAAAAGRRAVGRRAGDRAQRLRERGIERLVDVRTADPARAARGGRQSWPTGCGSSPTATTIGRS